MELFKKSEVQPFFLLIIPVWLFYGSVAVVVVVFTLEDGEILEWLIQGLFYPWPVKQGLQVDSLSE